MVRIGYLFPNGSFDNFPLDNFNTIKFGWFERVLEYLNIHYNGAIGDIEDIISNNHF